MLLRPENSKIKRLGEWALKYAFFVDSTYTVNKRIYNRRSRRDLRHHDRMLTKVLRTVKFDF